MLEEYTIIKRNYIGGYEQYLFWCAEKWLYLTNKDASAIAEWDVIGSFPTNASGVILLHSLFPSSNVKVGVLDELWVTLSDVDLIRLELMADRR